MKVEHTRKQKVISLIAFLWIASMAFVVIVGTLQNGSSVFSKLATILCATLAFLLFAYPCWFTFTYSFQVDDTKIVRKAGFTQTETKWDDVVAWSIKSRPKKKTFDKEPVLKDAKGQEMSLDAAVWYSSSNIAQAREQFMALVQAKLPDKCENSR
jgi:hypothetical protein